MKPTSSPQNQEQDQEIIEILKGFGELKVEYPPELLAARRAAFVAQVKQAAQEELPSEEQVIKHLEGLQSARAEYPPELLTARRAAFLSQVEQQSRVEVREELYPEDQDLLKLFKSFKAVEADYPAQMMAARRTALKREMARQNSISLLEAIQSSIRSLFQFTVKVPSIPTMSMMRTSLVVALLMLLAFVGSVLGNRGPLLSPAQTPAENTQPVVAAVLPTITEEPTKVICKPGYLPPLCLAKEVNNDQDLTDVRNGTARPAVAKDTLPGHNGIHRAAYVNDGLYGPGASWISNSAYSWIKIDLGKPTTINTITFGRDRLGNFNDRDPGQFVIAVALSDNVYADGNSSNDYIEYTQVYSSEQTGFSGVVSGSETIKAYFAPVTARFIKITFTNAGTAIDEVEAFMAQPPLLANEPTKKPQDDEPVIVAPAANTAIPVATNPPPTAVPPTDIPPTKVPPTKVPPTDIPPTDIPPTKVPPTKVPPTEIPPTDIPPTRIPPTPIPPTDIPPTDIPPTDIPPADTPAPQPIDTAQPTDVSTGA